MLGPANIDGPRSEVQARSSSRRRAGMRVAFPPDDSVIGVTNLVEIAAFRRRQCDWWPLIPSSSSLLRRVMGETLFVIYQVALPKDSSWTLMNAASADDLPPGMEPSCLALTPTQTSQGATETGNTGVFVFNELLQTSYHRSSAAATGQSSAPKLLLEAISEDVWGRQKHEGYGFLELPQTAGRIEAEVPLWKPPSSQPEKDLWCGTFDPLLCRALIAYDIRGQQQGGIISTHRELPLKGDRFVRGGSNGAVEVNVDTIVIDRSGHVGARYK